MARIRSIKPEFWTDGKVRRLGDPTALLFIALWTFADDYGFFSTDTLELSLKVPRWRSQSLFRMLSSLAEHGLIRVSSSSHVGLIVGWEHQRIKDRRASKWNESEIEWDEISVNAQGSDRIRLGVERRGVERKGEDTRKSRKPASPAEPPASAPTRIESQATSFFIARYCEIWKSRHGSSPPITGKDAGIAKRVAKGWSEERIEHFLTAYFSLPDAFVVKAKHPLELFELKLKEIAAFADSGHFVTRKAAVQADDMASNMILLEQVRRGEV